MSVSCHRLVTTLRKLGRAVDVAVLAAAQGVELQQRHRDGGRELLLPSHLHPATSFHMLANWLRTEALGGDGLPDWAIGFGANLPGLFAVSLQAWLAIKAAVMVRGNDLDRDWFDAKRAPWVREALSRARLVTTVSKEKQAVVKRLFPATKVEYLPNGVDPGWWRPLPADIEEADRIRQELAPSRKRLILGIFGEIKEKKGIDLLLRAMRRRGLKDRFALLVVGRLDQRSQELLNDPVLSPEKVLHLRFQQRERIAGLYRACDLVAIPSLYDGMPNVMLEAMACGVPVLASSAGGMPDVIDHGMNGLLFPAGSWEDCADCLAQAVELGGEGLKAMGMKAQAVVKEGFHPQQEAGKLLRLLGAA